ncbi:MAG TPA: hypothetical protein VFD82_20395 [Planctomycetota bacterium]|nr:hypothetical protein [Planctomycetota bacterium]
MSSFKALWLVPLLLLSACWDDDWDDCDHCDDQPRLVSIEIEVYDPVTQFVWEGVTVRIVEADQEWSGLTHVSPYQISLITDSTGRVFFDEFALADASIGFVEDADGRAVLGDDAFEDEARVMFEISAEGHTPVTLFVPLSWHVSDVFVAVPFN